MKKVLLAIAVVVVVVVLGFVGIVAMQPSKFRVERSATMAAPADRVFAQVNDFHKWNDWSPWAKLDPKAKNLFEGPESGEGAIFRWAGNAEVGEGSMTILESKPNEKVRIELAFIKPFEDIATTEFTLKPNGQNTAITWSMYGEHNFVEKIFCMFMNMDQMIGSKYEEGLASMKKIVEAEPAAAETPAGEAKPADKPPATTETPATTNP